MYVQVPLRMVPITTSVDTAIDKAFKVLGLPASAGGGPTQYGWHVVADWLRCPLRAHLRYDRRVLASQESVALQVGSLVHALLAVQYYPGLSSPGHDTILHEVEAAGAEPAVVSEALRLIHGYNDRVGLHGDAITNLGEVLATEVEVTVPSNADSTRDVYTARLDLVLRAKASGRIIILDHKTTAARTADVVDGWALNGGLLGGVWAANKSLAFRRQFAVPRGQTISDLAVNLIVKTKTPQYELFQYVVTRGMLAEFSRVLASATQLKRTYAWSRMYPRTFSCIGRFGRCEYWDYCLTGSKQGLRKAAAKVVL